MDKISIPLHPAQHDVYTEQLINRNSPLYNVGGYIRLIGPLNKDAFFKVVSAAPEVFDAFRLRYNLDIADFSGNVESSITPLHVEQLDFSNRPDAASFARQWMHNDFNVALPVQAGRVLARQALIGIGQNEYWFYGKYHHLITDGYGFIVWVKYLAEAYRAAVAGEQFNFSPPQYLPQILSAYNNSNQTDLDYWKQKFTSTPDPLLQPKTGVESENKTLAFEITWQQQDVLSAAQQSNKAGVLQLTLAALSIYFHQGFGADQVVFGVPVHKRSGRQMRNILGMFSGILPFKSTCQTAQSANEFLSGLSASLKEDFKYQSFVLGDLVRALKLSDSHKQLFQVMVNYEPFNFALDFGADIQSSIYQLASNAARSPLQFTWQDHGPQQPLQLQVDFDEAYFDEQQARHLIDSVFSIIAQFTNPNIKVGEIDILGEDEKQLLQQFEACQSLPFTQSVVELIAQQVKKTPDAIALKTGGTAYTYSQLNEQSNRVANYLDQAGISAGEMVPVCVERGFVMVASIIGVIKAGAAYVPIDPEYPAERIAFMLADTNARLMLTSTNVAKQVAFPANINMVLADDEVLFKSIPTSEPKIEISLDQLAYVIYTSGSTGQPKGVMIGHRNTAAFLHWCRHEFDIASFDSVYATTSVCFDLSVFEMFYPLTVGKTIKMLQNGLEIADHLPHDTRVLLNTVPAVINGLVKQGVSFDNVTIINMAGEPVPSQLVQQLDTGSIQVRNLYGPTEDTTYSTVFRLKRDEPVLIGKPVENSYARLLNRQGQRVPVGFDGEICLGGDGVAKGYLNRPELTEERFVPDLYSNDKDARLYKTGDMGRWLPGGNLAYCGRIDNQVKIRGFRIEPGEIERVAASTGLVNQAVVVVSGEGENKQLQAFATANGDADAEAINSALKDKLPSYMIPSSWTFFDAFPLTHNGKVDRRQLQVLSFDGTPVSQTELPATSAEKIVASVWQQVLDLEKVGVNENFFELGGHSIKAIQVISQLHKQQQVKIEYSAFVHHPTVRQIALLLEAAEPEKFLPITKLPPQSYYPLSHAQMRTWILCQLPGGSVSFNSPAAFKVEGGITAQQVSDAVATLVSRHESLRTVFTEAEGKPVQKILSPTEVNCATEVKDFSRSITSESDIEALFEKEKLREFDLSIGPLFRVILVATPTNQLIFFNIHHIICDGWSRKILVEDFIAALSGKLVEDASLIQYKDFAAWQTGLFSRQQQFWNDMLGGDIPSLTFPTDFGRPPIVDFSGNLVQQQLSSQTTAALQKFAAGNNTTVNNVIFALYAALVAHHSKQQKLIVGSLASGRSHADVEQMVGLFINFLPIPIQVNNSLSLREYVQHCSNTLASAYGHQDYPFDLLVDHYQIRRNLSRNPLFDTMVNFHSEAETARPYVLDIPGSVGKVTITPLDLFKEDNFQSNLDFKLDVESGQEGMLLNLSYNANLFTSERMTMFLSQFATLVQEAVTDAGKPLGEYLHYETKPGIEQRQQIETAPDPVQLDVCICTSFVCEPIAEYLEYWSNEYNLQMNIKFADYNQVFQQLLNPLSGFNANKGLNVLMVRVEDWLRDSQFTEEIDAVKYLDSTYDQLLQALQFSQTITRTPVIFSIVPPNSGNGLSMAIQAHITKVNAQLAAYADQQQQLHLVNFDDIARLYDVPEVFDTEADRMGHMPFSPDFYAALGTAVSRKIKAYKSKVYKVIALDCDNTLWKGICGEIGWDNVDISPAFTYLQQFMLKKYNEGFLLVLCSKNNEADVWEVFEKNKAMVLQRQHVAAHRINWNNKAQSLGELAAELNLGIDSFVFIDDNPFEVEQMQTALPGVLSIAIPENDEEIPELLDHTWELDVFSVTEEDSKRNQMYMTERSRKEQLEKHNSLEDFLTTLQIKLDIRQMTERDLDRAVQLSLRTNQFNLNGIRHDSGQMASRLGSAGTLSWMIDVSDRFGEYGTVGLLLGRVHHKEFIIESFLLSCRVLGRGVEHKILAALQKFCAERQLLTIVCQYQPTAKNKPFQNFLQGTGWVQGSGFNHSIMVPPVMEEVAG